MKRFVPILVVIFLATGCATATWAPVGGEYRDSKQDFDAELPEGWLKVGPKGWLKRGPWLDRTASDPLFKGVMITRDGELLNRIIIGQMDVGIHGFCGFNGPDHFLPRDDIQFVGDTFLKGGQD